MKLVQRQSPNVDYELNISLSIDKNPIESYYSSKLAQFSADLKINIEKDWEINEAFIEQDGRGAVKPAVFHPDDQLETKHRKVTVVVPKSQTTTLRIYLQLSETQIGPFVFELPAYNVIEMSNGLISGALDKYDIDDISNYYGSESKSEAIFTLLGDIDNWVSIRTYFQLLDSGARISENVQESIESEKTAGFLARQIAYPDNLVSYPINSMQELDQILSTCDRLEHIPDISKYRVIGFSLSFIKNEEFISQFWEVEKQFDIAREHWEGLLDDDQMATLLAVAVEKRDYERARDIIESWIGEASETVELNDMIEDVKEKNTELEEWRDLLRYTLNRRNQRIEYVLSLYLRELDRKKENYQTDYYLRELIAKARAEIADRINLQIDCEVAKYRYYSTRGQRFENNTEYDDAADEYQDALSIALKYVSELDGPKIISPVVPIFWIHYLRAKHIAQKNEYQTAIEKVQNGIDYLKNYSGGDNSQSELYITRLQANKHELEGDKALENQDLDQAENKYGQAIYNYTEIDRTRERDYLLKRNKLITASLAEQRGDFEAAKQAHRNVADLADKQSFKNFNFSRARICESKQLIINESWEEVRNIMSELTQLKGLSGVEAKHLAIIVEAYDAYERGEMQDCGEILNQIDMLQNIGEVADEFPFEYGHDYRPALVNILAAQRLKAAGVDTNLLDELIEVSLSTVLAPNQAELEIDQWGIEDMRLRQQWRHRFPTHVVKRYEEIKTDAAIQEQNYSDEALGLLRLLEQTLEFAGDYFANKQIGPEWQQNFANNDKGRLSLGALRDFLNDEVMKDRVWRDDVCELIDRNIIGVDDVIELRNQFGHDRKPHIEKNEYIGIKERVNEIFSRIASEIPVMGEVVGEHKLGAYRFTLHWENATDWCYLSIDKQIDHDAIYYLPPDLEMDEKVVQPDENNIIACSSERALNNLRDYTSID
jgi:hypothetical protein